MIQTYIRLALLVCIGILSSCTSRANDPVQPTQVNLNAAIDEVYANHIIAVAAQFKMDSDFFQQSVSQFCSAKDLDGLQRAQEAWRALNESWFALANYKFGPLVQDLVFPVFTFIDSYRLRGTDYTTNVRVKLADELADGRLFDASYFANKTFQFTGLLPLEVLLFESIESSSRELQNIFDEYQSVDSKCALLEGYTEALNVRASAIVYAWQVDYLSSGESYLTEVRRGDLGVGVTPISLVLTSVQEHLDYLHKRNVVDTVAQISDHIWPSLEAAILDIQTLLSGDSTTTFSLFEIMSSNGYGSTVDEVSENLQFALTSIAERDKVNLALALTLLDGNFKRNIPSALNVNLGINFSDGD